MKQGPDLFSRASHKQGFPSNEDPQQIVFGWVRDDLRVGLVGLAPHLSAAPALRTCPPPPDSLSLAIASLGTATPLNVR